MVAATLNSPGMTDAAAAAPATPAAHLPWDTDAATNATSPAAGLMLASLLSLPLWGLVFVVVRLVVA